MAVQPRSPVRVAAPLEIADDGGITLDVDGRRESLGYPEIARARVEVELNRPETA